MSIDCAEVRGLLDAGLRPHASDPAGLLLGFHLAGCADCRDYRAAADAQLLSALLNEPLDTPAPPRATATRPRPTRVATQRHWLTLGLLCAAGVVALLLVFYVVLPLLAIQQNVAAMQLPTALPRASASPGLPTPALPAPTLLSLPTAVIATPVTDLAQIENAPVAAALPPSTTPTLGPTGAVAGHPVSAVPSATLPIGSSWQPLLPTLMPTNPASDEALTILLLGVDQRPGEQFAARADAIMVVRLDPVRQRVALLSLPRDLIVGIPGYGSARINAAAVYGANEGGPGGSIDLMRRTVSNLLDIPIDYTLQLSFEGFMSAIDSLGGVTIDVEQELYDAAYPTMDYGYMVVRFLPGEQQMDGERALIYSRVRHMDNNYARNRRQQQVVLAVVARVRERGGLGTLRDIAALTRSLRNYIHTDLTPNQIVELAWTFRNLTPQQVERYALDETMVQEGVLADDPYATFALPGAIDKLVRQMRDGRDA